MKAWKKVISPVLIIMLLTGCWDHREINDVAIIIATAVDKEKDGLYRVSFQLPLPGQLGGSSGGGGGTGGNKSYYIDSEVGKTLSEATSKLQNRMSRKLFLGHRRIIIVGEKYARAGIENLFDEIARIPENRLTTYITVAKGSGEELLAAEPKFERYSGEALREITKSPHIVTINLKNVAQAMSHYGSDAIIPYIELKKIKDGSPKVSTEVNVLGYAQFLDDKMVGSYVGDSAEGLLWMLPKEWPKVVTMPVSKKEYISLKVLSKKIQIKPQVKGNHITYDVNIKTEARVLENTGILDLNRPEIINSIEKKFNMHIKKTIDEFTKQMLAKSTDSLSLGLVLSRNEPSIWKNRFEGRWHEVLPHSISIQPSIQCNISQIGMISKNLAEHRKGVQHE